MKTRITRLGIEALETRALLSASVSLNPAGVLTVHADDRGDNIIVRQPDANTVQVAVNSEGGKKFTFNKSGVVSIQFTGGSGRNGDYFANLTGIASVLLAGDNSGTNYLQGGAGNDTIVGGSNTHQKDYLSDPAGSNSIYGGTGFNNIFGGKNNDFIVAGPGANAVYDILGTNVVDGGGGTGYLITNAQSTTTASPGESVVTFFQTFASAAPAVLQKDVNGNGILYLNPVAGQSGVSYTIDQVNSENQQQLLVTYTDATGTQKLTFNKNDVKWIGSFGTPGNDSWINNTRVNDVLYGSAGNDIIIGGRGVNVLKGHSGNNVLIGRGTYNDLTAGANTDVMVGSDNGLNVFRNNQANVVTQDYGYNRGDVVLGIPLNLNFTMNPNANGTPATDADYLFWYRYLARNKSI